MRTEKHSPSRLNLWQLCQAKYAYWSDWETRQKYEKPNAQLFVGEVAHKALGNLYRARREERKWELAERSYRAAWMQHPQRRLVFLLEQDEREHGLRGLEMLRTFFEGNDHNTVPLLIEEFLEATLAPDEAAARFGATLPFPITLTGRVDRVDPDPAGVRIIDYKTGRCWSGNGAESPDDLARIVYPVLVNLRLDRAVIGFSLAYLSENQWVEVLPSADEIARGLEQVATIISEMRSATTFPARPGRHCKWCDYLPRCMDGQQFVNGNPLPF